jgi:hypothetical protein
MSTLLRWLALSTVLGLGVGTLASDVFAVGVADTQTDQPTAFKRLVFREVQGLRGGYKLYLDGDGNGVCQVIYRGGVPDHLMMEKRYRMVLSSQSLQSLNKLIDDHSILELVIPPRVGIPEETRPELAFTLASGKIVTVAKWANDKHPDFDPVYRACLVIVETCASEGHTFYEGEYDSSWVPPL